MKIKINNLVMIISIMICLLNSSVMAIAEENLASKSVDLAISEGTFYHFNLAYVEVLKVTDKAEQDLLFNKLSPVFQVAYTEDVSKICKMLDELANNGSGRIYDQIQITISNSNINLVDKSYLLGEVTSWGRKLVWTEDYTKAMNSLGNAWSKKDDNSIKDAEQAISQIKNKYSREYLLEELNNLKKSTDEVLKVIDVS